MFDTPASVPSAPTSRALMQDPSFALALRLCGGDPVTLPSGLTLLHQRVAGMPVLMLPRAAPPPDLDAQLTRIGVHRRPLLLSPERPSLLPRALRLAGPRNRFVLDLVGNADAQRAMLHQNWRHQLGQAQRSPLRVRHAPLRPDDPMLNAAAKQARQRGFRDWPMGLTSAFAQIAPDQTRLFTATLRGTPVASMLFLLHGDRATYHLGLTEDAGRAVHAHNLLLWAAARWLAGHAVRSLDLGLSLPHTPGLDRFKRRTGARLHPTGGTWLRWRPLARTAAP